MALCGLTLLMTASDCFMPGPSFRDKVFEIEYDTPQWSPDGSQIVFSFAWNLFAVESDGSRIRRLTGSGDQIVEKDSEINVSPVISPDGSQVAYTNFEEPHFNIKTLKLKGWFKRKRTLAKIDANDINPVWSPDGTRIAFLSARTTTTTTTIFTQWGPMAPMLRVLRLRFGSIQDPRVPRCGPPMAHAWPSWVGDQKGKGQIRCIFILSEPTARISPESE